MSGPEQPARYAGPPFRWPVIAVLAASFLLLGLIARGPNTLRIDLRISEWVQGFDGPFGEALAVFGNSLGYTPGAITFVIILSSILAITRRHRELRFMVFVLLGRLIASRLKDAFASPRPDASEVPVFGTFDTFGFPSGHVTTATVTLGAIAFVLAWQFPDQRIRVAILVVWGAGVAISAWARIWHGAHWFTDAIGGALVGVTVVLVAANLSASVIQHRATGPQQSPPRTPAR